MEFLRVSQVIARLFQQRASVLHVGFTPLQPGSWIGPRFGFDSTSFALFQTRFPFGSRLQFLTLHENITRRPFYKSTSSRLRRALVTCKPRFSVSLSLPSGVLFTFSLTVCSSISWVVFSWSCVHPFSHGIPRDPAGTLDTVAQLKFRYRFYLSLMAFPWPFRDISADNFSLSDPKILLPLFASSAVRSPLTSGKSRLILFLPYLDVSVSGGFPSYSLFDSTQDFCGFCPQGFPIRDICESNSLRGFPAAFRSCVALLFGSRPRHSLALFFA